MHKRIKVAIIIITSIVLFLGLLILSIPFIFMLFNTPVALRSEPIKHMKEFQSEYTTIANLVQNNMDVAKDSEFKIFSLIGGNEVAVRHSNVFLELTAEEKMSIKEIENDSFCNGVIVYDKILVFGGIDGDKIAYAYKGRPPVIFKNERGNFFRLVKIEDNWYALVEIPKLL